MDQSIVGAAVPRMRTHLLEPVVPNHSNVVSRLLHAVPTRVPTHVMAAAVNHLLRGQLLAARLGELSGKRFRLQVDDASMALTFEITSGGLRPASMDPHVTIRGALRDFVALARRREDPDTLFFQRRLVVEGETETGLHLKNLLDGWDYDLEGHVRATLPRSLARFTITAVDTVQALRGLSQLRRPGSHRNNRPGEKAREGRR
jgi:O2-independent ubiquinone biosynthesis accessory factor UbiT